MLLFLFAGDLENRSQKLSILFALNSSSPYPTPHKKGNYPGLQDLFEKYHDQGLEVLAFPSNQVRFLWRESGWNEQLARIRME